MGVDRCALSFPLSDFEHDETAWSSVSRRNPGTEQETTTYGTTVKLEDGPGVFLGVQHIPQSPSPLWGKVEFNPSRLADPDGWELGTFSDLVSGIETAMDSAGQVMSPAVAAHLAKLKRLDVTRDFEGIARPGAFLQGLATVHRPWSRKNNLYNDASRAGAQTLAVGGKQSGCILYDKHAETDGAAPAGTLRFETVARTDWLKRYGGIETVGELTPTALEALAMDRFAWSGMGTEVSSTDEVVERVMCSGLSASDQRGLLGWLLMASRGKESPMAFSTASKYRGMARKLGVVLSPELFDDGHAFVARLDWDSGQAVCRAAA